MVYMIARDEQFGSTVEVRFVGDVPVEIREALIGAGFSWLNYKGAWAAIDKDDDFIRNLIETAEKTVKPRPVMTKEEEKALRAEYMERIMAGETEHWRKYYEGEIGVLVRLEDGRILNIGKPRIETRFCFGESGYDYDEAQAAADRAATSENYFRMQNLSKYQETIDILSRKPRTDYKYWENVWVAEKYFNKPGIVSMHIGPMWGRNGEKEHEKVSEEDRERLLEGYRKAYAAFEKRINTYLKRYGMSKVVTWTYWRDA